VRNSILWAGKGILVTGDMVPPFIIIENWETKMSTGHHSIGKLTQIRCVTRPHDPGPLPAEIYTPLLMTVSA
jgi:hypothetical protein